MPDDGWNPQTADMKADYRACTVGTAGNDAVARVSRVTGDVKVKYGPNDPAPVQKGDRLPACAQIITGPQSGVGLTFRDNTRAAMGQNARVDLADYASDSNQPGTNSPQPDLEQGAAAFVSGRVTVRRPGAMQVRTPAALLGVRG